MKKFIAFISVTFITVLLSITPAGAASYTITDVARHSKSNDCWAIINKNVYNLTGWIKKHPGGSGPIIGMCGKDGSSGFNAMHSGSSTAKAMLAKYKIGIIK